MASRRKKKVEEPQNHERWLITYSDLITVLLIFFIIMYSMGRVDMAKYAAIAESLNVVLQGGASIIDSVGPSAGPSIVGQGQSGQNVPVGTEVLKDIEERQLKEVKAMVESFLEEQEQEQASGAQGAQVLTRLSDNISIMEQERGLVISFKDSLLFASGSDQLNSHAEKIIIQVGKSLQNIPNYIRVEGHTDNLPISSVRFRSNWELSVLRATNVVHLLQDKVGLPPDRLAVIGYGEYRPLVANEDGRSRAMNRRVDIVILKKQYNYFEPINAPEPVPTDTSN